MPRLTSAGVKATKAFTVTELLLVVAVLSLLAALIFPLFSRAKKVSQRTVCSNNLRRLGEGFNMYAEDWHGRWPCPGGLVGDRSYWSQSGSGGLQSYVKQRGVKSIWCCPLMTEWYGSFPARSYSMNSYLRDPADMEYPGCLGTLDGISVDKIPQPSRTILLFEGIPLTNGWEDRLDYIYRCANWSRVRGYTDYIAHTISPGEAWHGDKNNYLYVDNHIVSRKPGRKTSGTYSTYDEMYEWYVDKGRYRREYAKYKP